MIRILFLATFLFGYSSSGYALDIQPGAVAPEFKLNSIESNPVSLSSFKNKVVILVYWRPDQDRSVLALKDIRDILKKNNDKRIQVIGIVSGNEDPQTVKKIIKDNQIDFPVVIDAERNVFSYYGIHVYPSTVIINKEGKVVYGHPGHAHDYLTIIEGYIQLEFISPPKNK